MEILIPTQEKQAELGLTRKKTEVYLRRLEMARSLTIGQLVLFEYRGGILLGKVDKVYGSQEEPQFLLSQVEGFYGQTTITVSWYHISAPFFPVRSAKYEVGQLVWWNNGNGIQEGRIEEIVPDDNRRERRSFRVCSTKEQARFLIPDYRILGRAFESAKNFDPFLRIDT